MRGGIDLAHFRSLLIPVLFPAEVFFMSRKFRKPEPVVAVNSLNTESSVPFPNLSRSEKFIKYLKSNWLIILVIGFFCVGAFGAGLKYLEDSAKREIAKREIGKANLLEKQEESLLNSINPFLPAPLPNPTPQLSKEYVCLYSNCKKLSIPHISSIIDFYKNEKYTLRKFNTK